MLHQTHSANVFQTTNIPIVSPSFREWNPHGQAQASVGRSFSYIIEQAGEAIVNKRFWISFLIRHKKILQKGYAFFKVWYSFWLT
ncbi:MAG TPA: hypothetical protein VG052_16225, partial [Puia sp.]|nr:hypothetical protein [Puia sp.]